ncbi:MAG: flavodoxin family protein [Rectinemataceae bacterium]|jgi:multimeric flavodoxin WrbA
MNVLIISGTPKHEGLTHSCVQSARDGVVKAGGDCAIVNPCEAKLDCCEVCNDGWGTCQKEHVCSFGDDGFTAIQDKIAGMDALILVTPVYWGEMSEAMKAFFDRYRRCEATKGDKSALHGKQILLIAVPGDSGNGMVSCFEQMERLCRHLRAEIFDFVGVNRWNKEYKLVTISAAAAALVSQSRLPTVGK